MLCLERLAPAAAVSAFRHVFADRMGMTPGNGADWRKRAGETQAAWNPARTNLIFSRIILSLYSLEITNGARKLGSVIT